MFHHVWRNLMSNVSGNIQKNARAIKSSSSHNFMEQDQNPHLFGKSRREYMHNVKSVWWVVLWKILDISEAKKDRYAWWPKSGKGVFQFTQGNHPPNSSWIGLMVYLKVGGKLLDWSTSSQNRIRIKVTGNVYKCSQYVYLTLTGLAGNLRNPSKYGGWRNGKGYSWSKYNFNVSTIYDCKVITMVLCRYDIDSSSETNFK